MTPAGSPCELRLARRLADAEQRFGKVWSDLSHDNHGLQRQLDRLGLEGDLALCVRLNGGDWLEMNLDYDTSPAGIAWVTYHVADCTDQAERAIYPTSSPALWQAARHYLGRAIAVLDVVKQGTVQ